MCRSGSTKEEEILLDEWVVDASESGRLKGEAVTRVRGF